MSTVTKTMEILLDATETRDSSGSSKCVKEPVTGCCSNGSCEVSWNKKTPSPVIEMRDLDIIASNGPKPVKAVNGWCSDGTCQVSSKKKTLSILTEMSKGSDLSASNSYNVIAAVRCHTSDGCKSAKCCADHVTANLGFSAANNYVSKATTTSTDSCADPSNCRSCIVPVASQA